MGAKLVEKTGTGLIRQDCRGVAGINAVVFTWGGIRNARITLLFGKNTTNVEEAEKLICYIFEDRRGGEVSTKGTNLAKREISLNGLLIQLLLQSISKTIIKKFCWS